jgi:hypothetical protein
VKLTCQCGQSLEVSEHLTRKQTGLFTERIVSAIPSAATMYTCARCKVKHVGKRTTKENVSRHTRRTSNGNQVSDAISTWSAYTRARLKSCPASRCCSLNL